MHLGFGKILNLDQISEHIRQSSVRLLGLIARDRVFRTICRIPVERLVQNPIASRLKLLTATLIANTDFQHRAKMDIALFGPLLKF
jgi:hypothetical protein